MNPAVLPNSRGPYLRDFLMHIHARRRFAQLLFCIIFGAALLIAAAVPIQYTSHATLAILPAPEFTIRPDAGDRDGYSGALSIDQIMKAETAILLSDNLHNSVIKSIGMSTLYSDINSKKSSIYQFMMSIQDVLFSPWISRPNSSGDRINDLALGRFNKTLSVFPSRDSNVIMLEFTHPSPRQAAAVLQTLLALYADQRGRLYKEQQTPALDRQLTYAQAEVTSASAALATYKKNSRIINFNLDRDLILQRRNAVRTEIATLEAAIAEDSARESAISVALKMEPLEIPLYTERDTDLRTQAIAINIATITNQIAAARRHYRDDSQLMQSLTAQLSAAQIDQKNISRRAAASIERDGRNPVLDPLRLDLTQAVVREKGNVARRSKLFTQAVNLGHDIDLIQGAENNLGAAERRKSLAESALVQVNSVLAARRVNEAAVAARLAHVQVIEPARIPSNARHLPILLIWVGAFFALVGTITAMVLGFIICPALPNAESLARATGLPVLVMQQAGE